MTRSKIASIVCALLLCCCQSVLGQGGTMSNSYFDNPQYLVQDTFSICGPSVAATFCWHTYNNITLTSVAVGFNGEMWGIASGTLVPVEYNTTTQGWDTKAALPHIVKLAVGNDSSVYALAACTTGTGCNKIWKYNGASNTWGQVASTLWFSDVSVGSDGDLWAISSTTYGCGKRVYHYDTSTSTFVATAAGLSQISVVNGDDVWGICASQSTSNVYHYDSVSWVEQAGSLSQIAASLDGVAVYGIKQSGAFQRMNADGSWSTITNAQPTQISAGTDALIYGVFGNTLQKYNRYTIGVSYSLNGSSTCPSSNCGTVQHTANISLTLPHHATKTASQSTLYSNQISINVSDIADPNDAFDCFDITGNPTGCIAVYGAATVSCPIMGPIYAASLPQNPTINVEGASTKVIARGAVNPGSCITFLGARVCKQPVSEICYYGTAPPDYNPTSIYIDPAEQWQYAWIATAACFRVNWGGGHGPWLCTPGGATRTPDIAADFRCTYNP